MSKIFTNCQNFKSLIKIQYFLNLKKFESPKKVSISSTWRSYSDLDFFPSGNLILDFKICNKNHIAIYDSFFSLSHKCRVSKKMCIKIPKCLEIFQIVWKKTRVSQDFPEGPETFHSVQKNFRVPRKFSRVFQLFKKKQILVSFFMFPLKKFPDYKTLSIKQCLNAWEVFLTLL